MAADLPPDPPNQLRPAGEPPYDVAMDARVTALEQIAISTKDALNEIKAEMREMRSEIKAEIRELRGETKVETRELRQDIKELRQDQKSDFRLVFGALITAVLGLAALMAHGFKWY